MSKPITFPLVVGVDYLDDLLKEMTTDALQGADYQIHKPSQKEVERNQSHMSIKESNLGDNLNDRPV